MSPVGFINIDGNRFGDRNYGECFIVKRDLLWGAALPLRIHWQAIVVFFHIDMLLPASV